MVDDAVVEAIAGHADARVPERLGEQAGTSLLEGDHGIVGGAAAEIGDQHRGAVAKRLRVEESGRDRLVHLADALEAERRECRLVALHRQRRIGPAARVCDRAPDEDVARQAVQLRRAMRTQLGEESREQVLEFVGPAVDAGGVEEPAGGERLERLDEAAVAGVLDEALDRPGPRLRHHLRVRLVALVPEAQRRAESEEERGEEVEHYRLGRAMRVRPGEHRVGGAEVEPQ